MERNWLIEQMNDVDNTVSSWPQWMRERVEQRSQELEKQLIRVGRKRVVIAKPLGRSRSGRRISGSRVS